MSDLKVVEFKRDEASEFHQSEVIRKLEEALSHAKSEKCISLALLMICSNGNVVDCYHNGGRPYVMVGAIEALKHDFISAQIESR